MRFNVNAVQVITNVFVSTDKFKRQNISGLNSCNYRLNFWHLLFFNFFDFCNFCLLFHFVFLWLVNKAYTL
ncbi:MAG: hypothetical protein CME82_11495 [Halomonas sp.]|nr:hypothetical protein [Halomonas sp.]